MPLPLHALFVIEMTIAFMRNCCAFEFSKVGDGRGDVLDIASFCARPLPVLHVIPLLLFVCCIRLFVVALSDHSLLCLLGL